MIYSIEWRFTTIIIESNQIRAFCKLLHFIITVIIIISSNIILDFILIIFYFQFILLYSDFITTTNIIKCRRLAAGGWCHVFPEGGIWQRPVLGGRENGRETEIGHLKWGVGKLIAHSPQKAIVIPFIQYGMETLMPQHPVTKKLDSYIPIPGHNVLVILGEEMNFDDLIKEHEDLYGILWKYKASVDEENNGGSGNFHDHWDSKPEELKLYHKITLRIEKALNSLNSSRDAA